MKRAYELMFIIAPEATEEEREKVVENVEKNVKAMETEQVAVEKMGNKKLAYPIDKKNTGFYVLIKFVGDGTGHNDLESKLNLNEKIMRYLFVKAA